MPDKLKEYVRERLDRLVASMPPEELLKRFSVEERLAGLTAEELARALPPETLKALARQLKVNGQSPEPQ